MFGKYNGFVSNARGSACMYFLVADYSMNVSRDDSSAESPHSQANPYPRRKGFSIGQPNIASLVKHIEELRIFNTKTPFDILCINETRQDNTIKGSEAEIEGYDLVRHERSRNGGGVAIYMHYVRNVIRFSERKSLINYIIQFTFKQDFSRGLLYF